MQNENTLEKLEARGIEVWADGNTLRWRAPEGVVTKSILDELKERKIRLLEVLRSREADGYPQGGKVVSPPAGASALPHENSILLGDCLERLKELPDESIDQIVTDPPYGLKFMGKNWDKAVPGMEVWRECLRVLKPGAFAYVMCAPRQDCLSRMIVNLQDAGFDIGFTSIYWAYAQGFPKAHNISKAVDKRLGEDRKKLCRNPNSRERCDTSNTLYKSGTVGKTAYLTGPSTNEAKRFDGSYAGFQPKPAVEVILVVMKPRSEKTSVEQALKNGKGITWLDDCRVPFADVADGAAYDPCCRVNGVCEAELTWSGKRSLDVPKAGRRTADFFGEEGEGENAPWSASSKGRFPANLLVSESVLDDGNVHKLTSSFVRNVDSSMKSSFGFGMGRDQQTFGHDHSGGYSRFFSLDAWAEKNLPFVITPKPGKKEKTFGLETVGEKKVNDGRKKDNDTAYQRGTTLRKNTHTTVKPITLMAYLITMASREGDVVLDPFVGSGTTCIAAKILGRRYIGIEKEPDYHTLAQRRVAADWGAYGKSLLPTQPRRMEVVVSSKSPENAKVSSIKRSVDQKAFGTREWADKGINCCTGCSHDCRYCYAKESAIRYGQVKPGEWHLEKIRWDMVEKGYRRSSKSLMFPSSHDITPTNLDACMTVLGKLLRAGNPVLVVSKPHMGCISSIMHEFKEYREQILFRFTIGAMDDELLSFWEPNAPSYQERKQCLKIAAHRLYRTSVSIEPMLDADHIKDLVADLRIFVTESIWIGKMNQIRKRVKIASPAMEKQIQRIEAGQTDERIKAIYEALKRDPLIRWKESIRKVVKAS